MTNQFTYKNRSGNYTIVNIKQDDLSMTKRKLPLLYFTYDYQQQMEQDQEHIVQDEPLKVLALFPKRLIQEQFDITVDNYSRLYDSLTCTICRELLKTPVYLRCSHRFCKQCIEKYIRTNTKKSCPNCRGQLTTKRDLRSDYLTQSFIRFTFQDPKTFSSAMQRFDKLEVQKSKVLELRRLESQPELGVKFREANDDSSLIVPRMKRTKTADGEESKRKRKNGSEKKIESKGAFEKEEKEQKEGSKRPAKQTQQKEAKALSKNQSKSKQQLKSLSYQFIKPEFFKSEKSKKKIEVIEIDSKSEQDLQQPQKEVEEIRREDFFLPEDPEDRGICSINNLPEIVMQPEPQDIKIFSFRDAHQSIQHHPSQIELHSKAEIVVEQQPEKMVSQQDLMIEEQNNADVSISDWKPSPEVVRAIEILKQEFGEHYQSKIIQLSPLSFYCQIQLKKLPSSIFTPELVKGTFKMNLKASVSCLSSLVADLLNINKESIRLFVQEEKSEQKSEIELRSGQKLYEVNNKFWKDWGGVELFELKRLTSGANDGREVNDLSVKRGIRKERIVYYIVDFSKIIM